MASTIEGDSLVVKVAAYASEGGGGGDVSTVLAKVSRAFRTTARQMTTKTVAKDTQTLMQERLGKLRQTITSRRAE